MSKLALITLLGGDGDGGGIPHPSHPITLPGLEPGHPIVIPPPPEASHPIDPGGVPHPGHELPPGGERPTHPIYLPILPPGEPSHPIALPPGTPGNELPEGPPLFTLRWSVKFGWVLVPTWTDKPNPPTPPPSPKR